MKKIQTQAALTTLNTNTTLTMSSREIAELTGKRHANVIRDIREMLTGLGITELTFESSYIDSTGRALPCFNLPKELTITLVSGYNVQMRYAITKRWMELEAQAQGASVPAIPTNLAEALRLAADLAEQKETLRLQNEAMKPAAIIGAAVSARKQTTLMEFARKLPGVNTMQVKKKLAELGYIRKRQGASEFYSTSKKCFGGKRFSVMTLTGKGMELVSRLYLQGELQMLKGQAPVSAGELENILSA